MQADIQQTDLSMLPRTYCPEEERKAGKFHFKKAFPGLTILAMNSQK